MKEKYLENSVSLILWIRTLWSRHWRAELRLEFLSSVPESFEAAIGTLTAVRVLSRFRQYKFI
jgi:hypothetical protein